MAMGALAACGSGGGTDEAKDSGQETEKSGGADDYEAAASRADWIVAEDLKTLDKDQGYKVGFTDNFAQAHWIFLQIPESRLQEQPRSPASDKNPLKSGKIIFI